MTGVKAAMESGVGYLLREGEGAFPDCTHRMRFPKWAGFSGTQEEQRSDIFPRAILGAALWDVAARGVTSRDDTLRALAKAQAEYLWTRRCPGFASPFRYFPDLPELPPDSDTLAAITLLFARVCPERLGALGRALDFLGREAKEAGLAPTWVLHPEDPPEAAGRMAQAIKRYWGSTYDACVNARVALALQRTGRGEGARGILRSLGAHALREGRMSDRWYDGEEGPTALGLSAFQEIGGMAEFEEAAAAALIKMQRPDGGWGPRRSEALQSAQVLDALAPRLSHEDLERAVACLLDHQRRDGAWNGGTWIKMEIRGPDVSRSIATFGSDSVTTAYALCALSHVQSITMET